MKLPQMQNYWFAPCWPMPQANLQYWGKLREDLPDDAQVHNYHVYL